MEWNYISEKWNCFRKEKSPFIFPELSFRNAILHPSESADGKRDNHSKVCRSQIFHHIRQRDVTIVDIRLDDTVPLTLLCANASVHTSRRAEESNTLFMLLPFVFCTICISIRFCYEKCKISQKYLLFPPSKTTTCIICIFILHISCINTTTNNKLSLIIQILFIFPWRFHIFIVILQPQTYKNTSHEGKE